MSQVPVALSADWGMGHEVHTQVLVPVMNSFEEDLRKNTTQADGAMQCSDFSQGIAEGQGRGKGLELELMVPKGHSLKDSSIPST